jgi:succinoglycan biosynthesis protein ExoA
MRIEGNKEKATKDGEGSAGGAGTDGAKYVSVIIPCREEKEYIAKALRAVLANDWPSGRMEVLVVDGVSKDGTRDIVAEIGARDPRVRLVDNPGLFASNAMKVGVVVGRGDYIVRVDAHAEIPPDYVKTGVAILERYPGIWAVGGPVDRVATLEPGRFISAVISNIFATGNTPARIGNREGSIDAVAYPAWRREILERIGDFDDSLARNEDDDYFYRIRRAGGTVYQTQKMRAKYYVRGSVRQLLRQYTQYAFWKVAVAKKHGRFIDRKPLVPPAFFAALALSVAGGFLTPYLWLAGGVLAATYLLADVAASAAVAAKTGLRGFFKALAIFPVFHLRYAMGIVAGIWCFYVRGFSPGEVARRGIFSRLTR